MSYALLIISLISLIVHRSDCTPSPKRLIIDTDLFSDVESVKHSHSSLCSLQLTTTKIQSDIGALLLAATSPSIDLLAVNVNYPSSYSALAASSVLAHFGHPNTPIGITRPLSNDTFFDSWFFTLGEYASKVAYHFPGGTLSWDRHAEDAWDPVALYRKTLAGCPDGNGVTIVSIGYMDNISALMNSTSDGHSPLSGEELIAAKVSELVVMGGQYPRGREYNFWGRNASLTAHVVNNWKWPVVYAGFELGENVKSGKRLMTEGPQGNPASMAYKWYTYGEPRESWDPLTVLYAIDGLDGDLFEYGNEVGYNFVHQDGLNEWIYDERVKNQHFLTLKMSEEKASGEVERRLLDASWVRSPNYNQDKSAPKTFMKKQGI
ncbi:inosine-uridine preferring nucleoside hydrolase-domain-containing protein [Podospora fimiseda]|uniref:Inosine-uridine preferring nucleoside hydrolase-domain-containing protein n=1 Tax=Podospora fimiseda TaxID=252190 RepID=A0AAN6YLG2_9PEZI|nr:inosine-uridine preferring nucleoside hydrolase-domain-containing protein [Podospora fimiseda]